MEIPFDIIYAVGHRCDFATRVKLCMASKDFCVDDKEWLVEQQLKHFDAIIRVLLNEFQKKRTRMAKIRMAHIFFRNMLPYKHILKHPQLSEFCEHGY